MKKSTKKNILLYNIITFLIYAQFALPVWAFYGTEYLELSFSQVAMLVSLASFVRVILEVPTGSWADRFGRKKIFVVG
ncbi:MFS transporter, partial [Candidatus Dojkabacteria bacterium]|nr:MFS transporter [Candidatus Dojkabacteria bacterium]